MFNVSYMDNFWRCLNKSNNVLCSLSLSFYTKFTYRLDASQHSNISSKVCGLEDRLVISLEVEVDH